MWRIEDACEEGVLVGFKWGSGGPMRCSARVVPGNGENTAEGETGGNGGEGGAGPGIERVSGEG